MDQHKVIRDATSRLVPENIVSGKFPWDALSKLYPITHCWPGKFEGPCSELEDHISSYFVECSQAGLCCLVSLAIFSESRPGHLQRTQYLIEYLSHTKLATRL